MALESKRSAALVLRLIAGLALRGGAHPGAAQGTWSVISLPPKPGEVVSPRSLAVDTADDGLYIAEEGNDRAAGEQALGAETVAAVTQEYRRLVAVGWAANPAVAGQATSAGPERGRRAQSKARNLLWRLDRGEREVLAFVEDFDVPFDNNQAERDLGMMKVQQKISCRFRSTEGAHAFGRIRGDLVTMREQAQPMLTAIENVFLGHPVVPSLSG